MANGDPVQTTPVRTPPPEPVTNEAPHVAEAADTQVHTDEVPEPAPAVVGPDHLPQPDKPFFAGYPLTKWHPVHGRRTADDPNAAHTLFQPASDWFDSAGEADMHRTDLEAQSVIHHNRHVRRLEHEAFAKGEDAAPATGEGAQPGPVRNSVAAQESLNAGNPEPM